MKKLFQEKELNSAPTESKLSNSIFYAKMTLSLLTILACIAMVLSSAFAFFYKSVETNDTILKSAYYTIELSGMDNTVYTAPLTFEDKHSFVIHAAGTATTGYCKIQIGDDAYYTEQINQGQSLSLTITAAKDTVITFIPQWGTSSYYVTDSTCGNLINHSTTPYATYTVESTAKLSDIALHYGISENDILIFNGLPTGDVQTASLDENELPAINVGDVLKIPGVAPDVTPYAVPFAEYTVEVTATLADISHYYGISETDILTHSGLAEIKVGDLLRIPGVDPHVTPYAVPFAEYEVEATAMLSDIALYYGVSESDILAHSGLDEIKVGDLLKIPGVDPGITPFAVPFAEYRVEATATLSNIAAYYGVSESNILTHSGLSEIKVGDLLRIPGIEPDVRAYAVPYASYTVEPTAKLSDIALYYGISENNILIYNDIQKLTVGSVLKIPGVNKTMTPYAVEYVTLNIVDGATIEGIAKHYGISIDDILTYNKISEIKIETTIKIPGVAAGTPAYVAPKPDPLNNSYYQIATPNKLAAEDADILVFHGKSYKREKDTQVFALECDKEGQYYFYVTSKMDILSFSFAITENIEQGYLKITVNDRVYYSVAIMKDSYVRLDIEAEIGSIIRVEACKGKIDPELGIETFYGDDLKNNITEQYLNIVYVPLPTQEEEDVQNPEDKA